MPHPRTAGRNTVPLRPEGRFQQRAIASFFLPDPSQLSHKPLSAAMIVRPSRAPKFR